MNFWIDIDNPEHVPFFKAVINELKERGHGVIVTAQNSKAIKSAINNFTDEVKFIGFFTSFFSLFKSQLSLLRSIFLTDYIKTKSIDTALSLGSDPLFYTCITENITFIFLLEGNEKIKNKHYFGYDKTFFLASDAITDQQLSENVLDMKKVRKYKGTIKLTSLNFDLRSIKDIVSKIELLNNSLPNELRA